MSRPRSRTLILTVLALSLACQKSLNRNQPIGTPEMIAQRQSVADLLKTGGPFQLLHRIADIPADVRPVFIRSERVEFKNMAEPGAPFQATDVTDPSAPEAAFYRLRSVALSKSTCLVFYQEGGFGPGNLVAIFKRDGSNTATFLWHAGVQGPVADPADLLAAMQNGEFYDMNP